MSSSGLWLSTGELADGAARAASGGGTALTAGAEGHERATADGEGTGIGLTADAATTSLHCSRPGTGAFSRPPHPTTGAVTTTTEITDPQRTVALYIMSVRGGRDARRFSRAVRGV